MHSNMQTCRETARRMEVQEDLGISDMAAVRCDRQEET